MFRKIPSVQEEEEEREEEVGLQHGVPEATALPTSYESFVPCESASEENTPEKMRCLRDGFLSQLLA